MCGGGGSDAKKAAREQQKIEAERQAAINSVVQQINAMFNNAGREPMYQQQLGAVRDLNLRDLDYQTGQARRGLKFNLTRAGLAGGSSDVDSQQELARRYNEGALKATQFGEQAASDMRMADERARMSLIGQAQAGLDSTSATQLALKNMEANSAEAGAQARYQSLGDLMADLADFYGVGRYALGQQSGMQQGRRGFGAAPLAPGKREQGSVSR